MSETLNESKSSDENETGGTEIPSNELSSISMNTTQSSISQNSNHDDSGSETSSSSTSNSRSSESQSSHSDDGSESSDDGTDPNSPSGRPPEPKEKDSSGQETVVPRPTVRPVLQKFSSISDDETPDKPYNTPERVAPTTMTPMSPDMEEQGNKAVYHHQEMEEQRNQALYHHQEMEEQRNKAVYHHQEMDEQRNKAVYHHQEMEEQRNKAAYHHQEMEEQRNKAVYHHQEMEEQRNKAVYHHQEMEEQRNKAGYHHQEMEEQRNKAGYHHQEMEEQRNKAAYHQQSSSDSSTTTPEQRNAADDHNQSGSESSTIESSNEDGDDECEDSDEDESEDDNDAADDNDSADDNDTTDDSKVANEKEESAKENVYRSNRTTYGLPPDRLEADEIIDLDSDLEQPQIKFNPDKIYRIRRADDTIALGKILQSRKNDEHYVHYIRRNRRLDEWVKSHRIILESPVDRETSPTIQKIISEASGVDNELCDRKLTRNPKRRHDEVSHTHSFADMDTNSAALEQEHAQITKVKYIDKLQIGRFKIKTWYYSPFPEKYGSVETMYVCEFCLKYMMELTTYSYHVGICKAKQPPGKMIYRDGNVAIYEVDGKYHQLYCQLLCLMAKLFLDHKTLYYDVEPFYFYVLCEIADNAAHIVGYFSKEKISVTHNNVACILILPPYQRNGYGKLLIAFSYELSRRENVIGSPEKPLSDLGRLSYRGYWAYTLLEIMNEHTSTCITIKELSELSGIAQDEIIYTLQSMKMVKYWKGEHIICVTRETIAEHLLLPQFRKPKLTIRYSKLGWERRQRITLNVPITK